MNCAGPHCTPWTRAGAQQGLQHDAMVPYYVYHAELTEGLFDINCIEESVDMPPSHYAEGMRQKHRVVWARFGPQDIGVPVMRSRFMGCALNLDTIVWLGPSRDEDVTEDFLKFFRMVSHMDASYFAGIDDTASAARSLALYADRQGSEVRAGART